MKYPNFIGQAHHGSGKTGAFTLAMLQRINDDDPNLQAIVICHARELAIQNFEWCKALSKYMDGISTYLAVPQGTVHSAKSVTPCFLAAAFPLFLPSPPALAPPQTSNKQ